MTCCVTEAVMSIETNRYLVDFHYDMQRQKNNTELEKYTRLCESQQERANLI